jgi:hypothetical protein
MSKSDSDSNSLGLTRRKKSIVAGIIATIIIVCCVCFTAYAMPTEDTVVSETVFAEETNSSDIKEEAISSDVNYLEMGYKSLEEYEKDMNKKHEKAKGLATKTIKKYKKVITKAQKENLRKYEKQMIKSTSPAEYDKALNKFNKLKAKLKKKQAEYDATGGVGKYTGGSFKIPYNFRSAGVLSDSKFRYTYYSSRVLYHYKTPQWTLCKDGLYRDKKGRVIVASDDYKHGTVINSPLFGTCIVQDCGVGRSGTLDVYVGF